MQTQASKQFHTAAKRRTFFDRKVLHYGQSRAISLGKVIPKEWQYVRVGIIDKTPNIITVTFTRLLVSESHAQTIKPNQTNRQNP